MPRKPVYDRRISRNMCAECGQHPAEEGFTCCNACRAERKDSLEKLIALRVCIHCCKAPAADGKQKCADCSTRINRTLRARRERRSADGKCQHCGKRPPSPGRSSCAECRERKARNQREYYHLKRLRNLDGA